MPHLNQDFGFDIVLVSARIELIFFLVAGIVQCFGFSRKIMLIATTKNISVLSSVYTKNISVLSALFSY